MEELLRIIVETNRKTKEISQANRNIWEYMGLLMRRWEWMRTADSIRKKNKKKQCHIVFSDFDIR